MSDATPTPGVIGTLRMMPPKLYIIGFATLVSRSGGFLAIFGSIYLTSQDITEEQVVTVLTAVGVFGLLGSLLSGRLADRFSPRSVLITASLVNTVVLIMLSREPEPLVSALLMIVASTMTTAFLPPAAATVGALVPPAMNRTPFFAMFRLFLNLGTTASPLIATLLGETEFDRLFVYSAVANAVAAVILAWGLHRPPSRRPSDANSTPVRATRPEYPLIVATVSIFTLLCVVAGIYAQYQSTLSLQIQDTRGALTLYSYFLVINSALVIIGELPLSILTRHLPIWVPLSGGVLIMTVGIAIAGFFAATTPLLITGAVLFTVGEMIFAPVTNTTAATLAPEGRAATYQGYLSAAQSLGFALGPAAGVAMYFQLSSSVWLVILGIGVACAVLLTATMRLRASQTKKDEPLIGASTASPASTNER